MGDMKKTNRVCMLIPQLILPVPAVEGGAIETLITNLLDENEKQKKVRFVVISKYNKEASEKNYQNSKVYYFEDRKYVGKGKTLIYFLWLFYKFIFHIIQNRITHKLFGCNFHVVEYLTFQYLCIAIKEKVDFVSVEGYENEYELSAFNRLVGKQRVYNHIHYVRKENTASRRLISNSLCISEYVKREWTKSGEMFGDNRVLYNGISLGSYYDEKLSDKKSSIREKYDIHENDTLVIFCGRIMQVKGVEYLLDAFTTLHDPHIKLMLIGAAPADMGYQEFADRMIERADAMDNVICMGYVDNHYLPLYYSAADIMVIPSVWQEGAGLVAVEGMAAGLPLIVTKSGGMVEYIDDSCAIKIPIDDNLSDALAEKILLLAKDKDLRERMGKHGKERAKLFSKEKYYEGFVSIIESI